MFCDTSPIWNFLEQLGATEDPKQSPDSATGLYLLEVFPALALASFDREFFKLLRQPKYNPANRKFKPEDWTRVADAAAHEANALGFKLLEKWFCDVRTCEGRRKEDQDKLDSGLYLLIALRWRLWPERCLVLGDLNSGYMVIPANDDVREYLGTKARRLGIPMQRG